LSYLFPLLSDKSKITNTYESKLTDIDVNKKWDDSDNQDGKRPESIEITLLINGEESAYTDTLNADNNWSYEFNDLDKYSDGKEIEYSIKEVEIEGYSVNYEEAVKEENNITLNLSNTKEVEETPTPIPTSTPTIVKVVEKRAVPNTGIK